ncbi:fluoride efflux transporter CrcB [Ancylobacter dichloromethanicus]|uniref:fluoride efflux transporter CrcB n=1 Tax=Ancylobacter dichloromethanicus TaxID=518825 RepID=UPI001BCD2A5B|nr:fluoride efflux transporter CrcB [Ancylobacter dichloromethanicus]MBS7554689.1 fluoride efflux transporter CrcB [Ancylobacter dichloromethanicus]
MQGILLIFIGAGIGGVLRNAVGMTAMRWFGMGFPFGTLAVNVIGSFIIGLVAGWLTFMASGGWTVHARAFLMTGILGGFTTFSTFSLDTALLVERGEMGLAVLYVGVSVLLALVGVFGGLALMRALA